MLAKFKVIRFFDKHDNQVVKTGLTLEEAQAHCHLPETSSATCTTAEGKARTKRFGTWFDGYTEEK